MKLPEEQPPTDNIPLSEWLTRMVILINGAIQDSPEYAEFYLSTGGRANLSSAALVLIIDQTRHNTGSFSLSNNEITINKTGTFRICFDCYINSGATNMSEYSMYMEVDTGAGFSEPTAMRSAFYERGYDSGHSASINTILSAASGDKIRFSIIRTAGGGISGYQDDNGTRLIIEEKNEVI